MLKMKLHILMAEKKLSQKEVNKITGITSSVMNKYYQGIITRVNPEHLDKSCKLFKYNVQDLIEYIPEEDSE